MIHNPKHPIGLLVWVIAGVFVVNLISSLATYGQSYLTAWSGQKLIANLRVRLFERTMRMPMAEFDRWRPGEFIARFTNDLALMTDALSVSLPQFFVTLVTLVGSVATMFYVDWLLSLFLFVFAPIVNFVVAFFTRMISASTKRSQERIADLSANLSEVLQGERIVKAFGREDHEVARFAKSNDDYFGAYMKVLQLGQTQTPIVAMIVTIALLAIMAFSVREAIVGRLTSGQVFQFWTLVVLAINPLNRLASFIADISRGLVGASRIFEVLDVPIESVADVDTVETGRIDGALRFDNVTFSYKSDASPVLHELSATIGAGEIVALVGPSGAGKTTIVNLVPRFYEPQSGSILARRHRPAHASTSARLRSAIAIVPQEALLFSGTVAENIRYGRLDATQSRDRSRGARSQRRRVRPRSAARLRRRPSANAACASPAANVNVISIARAVLARPPHPHPRRSDERPRQPLRTPDRSRPGPPPTRPHHPHHRAPPLDDPPREQDPVRRRGPDPRVRHPRRPPRPRRPRTPTSTPPNSPSKALPRPVVVKKTHASGRVCARRTPNIGRRPRHPTCRLAERSLYRASVVDGSRKLTMLVLTRKLNEAIVIGDDIRIVVVSVDRDQVRLGIEAPKTISVHRAEVYDEIKNANRAKPG